MNVRDCMTKKADVANPDMTISEVAKLMKRNDYGFLPVGENDRLVGVITDRDITVRAVAENKDPKTTKVRDCMTAEVLYCYDDQDVSEVAKNMGEKQVRRLPVVNRDKRLVGILSLGDMASKKEAQQDVLVALNRICERAHREPKTVHAQAQAQAQQTQGQPQPHA